MLTMEQQDNGLLIVNLVPHSIVADSDTVLVLSGDQVYLMDYRLMARQHAESNNPVTIACKAVSPRQRGRFGMVSRRVRLIQLSKRCTFMT